MSLSQSSTYLARLRGNAAQAVHDGATATDLLLGVVMVTRGLSRPGADDIDDAAELAGHLADLNDLRGVKTP